ncbi:MAG: hypothetical protein OHK0053_25200 [Microscillaceae bacterium]
MSLAQQKRTFTNIKATPTKDSTAILISFGIQTDTAGQTFDILDIEYFSEKTQKWAKVSDITPTFAELKGIAPGEGKQIVWNTSAHLLREGIRIDFIFKRINLPKTPDTPTAGSYTEQINGVVLEMVQIKGGTFMMGSPTSEPERESDETQHQVTLRDFKMGKYEVSQAQWRAVMGSNPSRFKDCDNCPVENVSWEDIQEFLQKLNAMTGKNYRLPTEAEWEYACRAGTTTPFYTGNNLTTDQANYDGNSKGQYRAKTTPVGSFAPNAWGLYDMHGNVWEWCSDWYDEYSSTAQTNPEGPATGSYRVLRGGSWLYYASSCRSANRHLTPTFRSSFNGFRLASF